MQQMSKLLVEPLKMRSPLILQISPTAYSLFDLPFKRADF
jgi:hypothetical protein